MYRPPEVQDYNTSLEILFNDADIMLINFGLHYRWKDQITYYEQMKSLLLFVQNVSINHPEKIIIWRESSAQHHIATGGEFSVAPIPTEGLTDKSYRALFSKCSNSTTGNTLKFSSVIRRQWRDLTITNISREIGLDLTNMTSLFTTDSRVNRGKQGKMYLLPFYNYTERLGFMHRVSPGESVYYKPSKKHVRSAFTKSGEVLPQDPDELLYMTCDPTHFCYSPVFWQPLIQQLYMLLEVVFKSRQ